MLDRKILLEFSVKKAEDEPKGVCKMAEAAEKRGSRHTNRQWKEKFSAVDSGECSHGYLCKACFNPEMVAWDQVERLY